MKNTHELAADLRRHARKIGTPAGDTPSVMTMAADRLDATTSELTSLKSPPAPGDVRAALAGYAEWTGSPPVLTDAVELIDQQAQRIADLETKCITLKRLHDAAADERDALRAELDCAEVEIEVASCALKSDDNAVCDGHECMGDYIRAVTQALIKERDALRAKYNELLVALHGIGAALGIPEGDRSPYSITCGVLERVNRLAEIESQEPACWAVIDPTGGSSVEYTAAWREACHDHISDLIAEYDRPDAAGFIVRPLYARPVPAQAVPDADGARFRWLCEDHSDRETRVQCRSLIDRLYWMSYSAAVMSIDAAMAAAPEHKA